MITRKHSREYKLRPKLKNSSIQKIKQVNWGPIQNTADYTD